METQDKDVRRVYLRHLHKDGPGMICVDDQYVKIAVYPESRFSSHVSHKNPELKKVFLEDGDRWFNLPIFAEIYERANRSREFEYLATALPFEQQPDHTKKLIKASLSKLESSTERQLSFSSAEQKTNEYSFQLPEDLIEKVNLMRHNKDALAKFGVDARRFRNAFVKKALEAAYENLERELNAKPNQASDCLSIVPKTAEVDPVVDWHENAIVQIFENDGGVIDKTRNRYHAEIFRKKAQELSISQLDLTYLLILNSMQDRPKNFFLLEVEDAKV